MGEGVAVVPVLLTLQVGHEPISYDAGPGSGSLKTDEEPESPRANIAAFGHIILTVASCLGLLVAPLSSSGSAEHSLSLVEGIPCQEFVLAAVNALLLRLAPAAGALCLTVLSFCFLFP